MRSDDQPFGEPDDWTPGELSQLKALSPEREPPRELKQRTADALRARGLLHRARSVNPRVVTLLAAAASVVFAAGAAVGYETAMRRPGIRVEQVGGMPRAVAQVDSSAALPHRQVVWF
jgi:hypothetical protein